MILNRDNSIENEIQKLILSNQSQHFLKISVFLKNSNTYKHTFKLRKQDQSLKEELRTFRPSSLHQSIYNTDQGWVVALVGNMKMS